MADRIAATCFACNRNANMDIGSNSIARVCYIYVGTNTNGDFIYRWPGVWCSTEIIAMARNARHDWIWYAVRKCRLHRFHWVHRSWGFFPVSIKHFFLSILNDFQRLFFCWRLERVKAAADWYCCCCCYFTFVDAITNHSTFVCIIFSISLFDIDSDSFFRNFVGRVLFFAFSHTLSLSYSLSFSRC